MILCPKCKSETEVIVERTTVQSVEFEWKSKGKGIKKRVLRKPEKNKPEVDRRLFIDCKNCDYISDNLTYDYGELSEHKEEIQLIEEQLNKVSF